MTRPVSPLRRVYFGGTSAADVCETAVAWNEPAASGSEALSARTDSLWPSHEPGLPHMTAALITVVAGLVRTEVSLYVHPTNRRSNAYNLGRAFAPANTPEAHARWTNLLD